MTQTITINIKHVDSIDQLHQLFKQQLRFPDFYGMNWDAFWDAITGLTDMPDLLKIKGSDSFKEKFPSDHAILLDIIKEYNHGSSKTIEVY